MGSEMCIRDRGQYSPLQMEEQVVSIYSSTPQESRKSWIRDLDLSDIGRYETEMLDWMHSNHAGIFDAIKSSGKFEDDTEQKLVAALDDFAKIFQPSAGKGIEAA